MKVYDVTNQTEPNISLAFSLPLLNFTASEFLMKFKKPGCTVYHIQNETIFIYSTMPVGTGREII